MTPKKEVFTPGEMRLKATLEDVNGSLREFRKHGAEP